MARSKAVLGDARRDKRAAWMFDRIVSCGSLVLREIGETRSGEIGAHRLLSSDDVDLHALLVPHVARTVQACRGRRIVAAQDTTEINFDRYRQPVAGLGRTGNTDIRGFFMHPVVAVDADDEALLGVVGARVWTREEEPTPDHRRIPFEEKESRRWLDAAETSARTRKSMRPPDHSSSSTFNTGKLSDALLSAGFTRRSASSLPSLCPMVMTSGSPTA